MAQDLANPLVPSPTGLSEAEARARLARDGPNRLPAPRRRKLATALWQVASQPMVLLLLACTLLYALLGSVFDSVVLSLSIVMVASISVYQERRTERILETLRDLASPRSTVVRDGVVKRIASQELVQGDRLIVQEGDRLACDATLVESHSVQADESSLTGESVPVDKAPGADEKARTLLAGTLIVRGDGAAMVTATGGRTALGRIGGSLASLTPPVSRLHEELGRLVRRVAVLALLTCVVVATIFAWRDGSWISGLLVGLTLGMAIVPEEFAVVWTVMMALGARRLAEARVLTRQPQAIEVLGTTTVLCVDKTGTLTLNRMEVVALHDGDHQSLRRPDEPPPEWAGPLLATAALASIRQGLEPMDRAVFRLAPGDDVGQVTRREGVAAGRPFVRQCWLAREDGDEVIAIKGAPEAVLARCAGPSKRLQGLASQAQAWAAQGLRVIAVARMRCAPCEEPPETGYEAVGLLGFEDPLRDDVAQGIQECRDAGVRVVMITGDAPATALAIARQAGLVDAGDDATALTGEQLDAMNEAQLGQAVAKVAVFARVTPMHKLRIVQALQHRGEVVAMTGDGVNDGPALRAADVGVAMGERGTDVAREAAALVLLDDRFGSLVDAVRAGRRIYANLQKAMGYLFAVHLPIVGLSVLPLLGGPVLLWPIHVALLELIIDPACSLVFEAEPLPENGMQVPPRAADAPLFSVASVVRSLAIGGVAALALVAVQWMGQRASLSDEALRLAALATIIAGNLLMLRWFRNGFRSVRTSNRVFEGLLVGVSLGTGVVVLFTPLREALGLPALVDMRWSIALLGVPMAWALWKRVHAARALHRHSAG